MIDPQGRPDQGKQGGVEHDRPVAVQGHVHGDQALVGEQSWSSQQPVPEGPSRRTPEAGGCRRGGASKCVCVCHACSLRSLRTHCGKDP